MSIDYTSMDVEKQLAFDAAYKEGQREGRDEAAHDLMHALSRERLCNCDKSGQLRSEHSEWCQARVLSEVIQKYRDAVKEKLGESKVPNAIKIACAIQANAWDEVDEHPIGKVEAAATYEKRGKTNVWTVHRMIKEQIADEIIDQIIDETFEVQDFVPKHVWAFVNAWPDTQTIKCKLCGAMQDTSNKHAACPDAIAERALTQLGGCLLAAEGQATGTPGGTPGATKGDYGWSPAYAAVRKLWEHKEQLSAIVQRQRETGDQRIAIIEGLRAENMRLKDKIAAQDKAREQLSAMYHGVARKNKELNAEMESLKRPWVSMSDKKAWVHLQVRCPDCAAKKSVDIEAPK